MNLAEFNELDETEKRHFYRCKQYGECSICGKLDDVLCHEDHVQRPYMAAYAKKAGRLKNARR
jgi:hypothetical protein